MDALISLALGIATGIFFGIALVAFLGIMLSKNKQDDG